MFGKQGYNIKIRGNEDLHGRTQIKLRSDSREATYLRTKLASDIHQRLGIPSISANYVNLYINNEFMGFYILEDTIKKSWIEYIYGDVDTTGLYECGSSGTDLSLKNSAHGCVNENDDVTDNTELIELLTALDNAQSAEDIEDIFDIDLFLTEVAYEYLVGSWDHLLLYGHNFYLYKQPNGKWLYFLTDYDADIGQDTSIGILGPKEITYLTPDKAYFEYYSFDEWAHLPIHIIDILVRKDPTRFENILKNFVSDVFNPAILFPHIDELKEFIRPYVVADKTLNENGKYPGKLFEDVETYSMAKWEANCEFTTIKTLQGSLSYGLKYWILAKYRYVCKNYNMQCDPIYTSDEYKFTVDENVEGTLRDDEWLDWSNEPLPTQTVTEEPPQPTPVETVTEEPPQPTPSPFVPNGQRAELFEMTEGKVPIIRVTIPDDEFTQLKEIASKGFCLHLPDGTVHPINHNGDSANIDWSFMAFAPPGFNPFEQEQFETKNAKMTFELDGYAFYIF